MKVIKIILYALLAIAALLLLMGLFGKSEYHIERTITIHAPQQMIMTKIADFNHMNSWSPWRELDNNMTTTIAGTPMQSGSKYTWKGNDKVGEGSQTITAITPDRVDIALDFLKPWKSAATTYFSTKKEGESTQTTWAMNTKIPFPYNGLAMFTDVDKGMGKDFDKGLANLKTLCEAEWGGILTYKNAATIQQLPIRHYAGIKETVKIADITTFYSNALPALFEAALTSKTEMAGMPCGLFWNYDEKAGTTLMAAAIPCQKPAKLTLPSKTAESWSLGGKAVIVDYYGDYAKTGAAHLGIDEYVKANNLKVKTPSIEEYITDPAKEKDPSKILTKVIYYLDN